MGEGLPLALVTGLGEGSCILVAILCNSDAGRTVQVDFAAGNQQVAELQAAELQQSLEALTAKMAAAQEELTGKSARLQDLEGERRSSFTLMWLCVICNDGVCAPMCFPRPVDPAYSSFLPPPKGIRCPKGGTNPTYPSFLPPLGEFSALKEVLGESGQRDVVNNLLRKMTVLQGAVATADANRRKLHNELVQVRGNVSGSRHEVAQCLRHRDFIYGGIAAPLPHHPTGIQWLVLNTPNPKP